jgi:hypothetical protein
LPENRKAQLPGRETKETPWTSHEKPRANALEDASPPVRADPDVRTALASPSGWTGWRGCARRFRTTKPLRAGDLGGFRPSQHDRDHDAETMLVLATGIKHAARA